MRELSGRRLGPHAGGAARQLVVLTHGLGASGADLIDLGAVWAAALPHAAFVAPDAPEPYAGAPMGRQWFDLFGLDPQRLAAGVALAASDLLGFVDAELARLGLGADAVALMGFSQGAMVCLHAGLTRAVPPRAVLAYSGALLDPTLPPGATPPPVLLVHGAADEVVPAGRSRDAARVLRAAGVPVELVLLPGLGHSIDEAGLAAGARVLRQVFAGAQ